jgi:23S rRNA (uracil1939-C5)-methyltransferase
MTAKSKKGGTVEVTFDSLGYGGPAVGRIDGMVVFTKYAAPGDRAMVRLTKSKKTWAEGQLAEVLSPGPARIAPRCDLFTRCGGCTYQHLTIEAQLAGKAAIVRDALRPLPGWDTIPVHPIVPSPDAWRYRNKVEFTFARDGDGPLRGGFHSPNNWWDILDVHQCHIAPEPFERVLRAAVAEGERQKLSTWSNRTYTGTLRQLVLRHSVAEDSVIALLLTGDKRLDFEPLAKALFAAEPRLKGVAWGLNDSMSDIARPTAMLATQGEDSFEERLNDLRFRVSLASFFQTNTRGAVRLYETTRQALQLTGREVLLDAYCGTGTIGLFCARECAHVHGIELVQEAIWDARANAALNGIRNTTFLAGDMRLTLPIMLGAIEGRIDRLVVDPPRGGMDKKALEQLLAIRAPRMVYVSCNPTTMARDLQAALDTGYRIESVTPVDMFPQTYHVECVAALTLQ